MQRRPTVVRYLKKNKMSVPAKLLPLLLCIALLLPLSASGRRLSAAAHDVLVKYGLPQGLLPDAVTRYSLWPDGSFEIELQKPCYVQFTDLVYYETTITGNITYGRISRLTGIRAKKLFIWVPVTGIEIDQADGQIEFKVGLLSEKLPAKQFEEIPTCRSSACGDQTPIAEV